MKKFILLLVFIGISGSLFSLGEVKFDIKGTRVSVEMTLEENEYIILNPDFLFLLVESDSYNFNFSGYPKGELQENGLTYYSGSLTLEGDLVLIEGVIEPSPLVDVTLGYQTCNKEGVCNMPVEITRELTVGTEKRDVPWVYILIVILSVSYFTLRSKYKPKDNGKK